MPKSFSSSRATGMGGWKPPFTSDRGFKCVSQWVPTSLPPGTNLRKLHSASTYLVKHLRNPNEFRAFRDWRLGVGWHFHSPLVRESARRRSSPRQICFLLLIAFSFNISKKMKRLQMFSPNLKLKVGLIRDSDNIIY